MLDDPRIKRVLKRYRKGERFFDASMDVSAYGDIALLTACRCEQVEDIADPRELDEYALEYFAGLLETVFDTSQFDYFLHSYIRSEFVDSYFDDPTVTSFLSPENGPPSKISLEKGLRWCAVRPKDGRERYEAFPIEDLDEEP